MYVRYNYHSKTKEDFISYYRISRSTMSYSQGKSISFSDSKHVNYIYHINSSDKRTPYVLKPEVH